MIFFNYDNQDVAQHQNSTHERKATAPTTATATVAFEDNEEEDYNNRLQSPFEYVTKIRQCMKENDILFRSDRGKVSDWAGRFIYEPINEGKIILGPLLPKSASTSFRVMTGHSKRPKGLKWREEPKPAGAFQIAAVRDPLSHFIATYQQAANMRMYTFHNRNRNEGKTPSDPIEYCNSTYEQKREWFHTYWNVFVSNNFRQKNEHIVHQLHYLQNYYDDKLNQNVSVIDRIDAIVKLENFDDDWSVVADELAASEPASSSSPNNSTSYYASQWMKKHRQVKKRVAPKAIEPPPPSSKNQRKQEESNKKDDSSRSTTASFSSGWRPICGEGEEDEESPSTTTEKKIETDVKTLRKKYATKFIFDHYLKEFCDYLKYDYQCLGYPFPKECVEALKG